MNPTLSRQMWLGLGRPNSGRSSTWPLDWAVPGVTAPTILFQFKGAPDQAAMVTNLGSGAPNYNGVPQAPATLPLSDVDRGAIFRGAVAGFTAFDGIATGYPLTANGTYYYYYGNQRLVSDYDGTSTVLQRTGCHYIPRTYLAHYFSTPRIVIGSGSSTYIGAWQAKGSIGLSRGKAYTNGAVVNGAMNTSWLANSVMFGGTYLYSNWDGGNCLCCDVPLFAWWSTIISDAEMAAWEAAVIERLEL